MKSDSVNIKVVVRIRPLNEKESQNECVQVQNNTICVRDMKNNTNSYT